MPKSNTVIMAFTAEQISRLAGISVDRLRYWEKTEAFVPERLGQILPGPYSRIYTFQDLVSLRVIAELRTNHGINLQQLRNVTQYITRHSDQPWSSLSVRVFGRTLIFRDPIMGSWVSAEHMGQLTYIIDFEQVSREAEIDARAAMKRDPDDAGQIVRHRNVMNNQWVFKGTRITVESIQEYLRRDFTAAQILRDMPSLTNKDIEAANSFALQTIGAA